MLSLILGLIVISICLSFCKKDLLWFTRSGNVVTFLGGILAFRMNIRLGIKGMIKQFTEIDGGDGTVKPDTQLETDMRAAFVGIVFAGIGAVIAGYGDKFLSYL